MVFKRLLGAIGVGGPSVDTVLDGEAVLPGGALSGQVRLRSGGAAVEIEEIGLELLARVEAEREEGESEGTVAFERYVVGGGFRLGADEERSVPFSVTLPWEMPVTELYGQPLGVVLGVRTELAVADARDRGDLDPLIVRPLPVQEAVLEALGQLGFGFRSADLEHGRIGGTGQRLPFYQEIELTPPPRYAHAVTEIELTFLTTASGLEVVLEADKRGGPLTPGHDALTRFTVRHEDVPVLDWNSEVDGWIRRLTEHREAYGAQAYVHSAPHAEHLAVHGSGSGSGLGTAVAAGAAGLGVGFVGGMVAAEVVDEIDDFFEGEEEDDQAEESEED
ncbi:sporulation protein [Streptomyces sp. NBC_00015]|uniref:sporulation protein n=1 Tax=unclassified Streptomyces TaxID=2593676 RepID=UPI00224DFBD1|nr:sporulation protein [Streptomyces sp. NBC_00103]MCX5371651.1 sporulation protein [Streptomyces sp. NBC_00103]